MVLTQLENQRLFFCQIHPFDISAFAFYQMPMSMLAIIGLIISLEKRL